MKSFKMLSMGVLALTFSGAALQSAPTLKDQAGTGPKRIPVLTRDQAKPPTPLLGPAEKVKPLISIEQFTARRTTGIVIGAYLRNHNSQAVNNAVYTIEQWTGSAWKKLKNDLVSVNGRGSAYIGMTLPLSNDAMTFRFQLTQSVEGSARASVPQRIFVVQYRGPEWNIHMYYSTSTSGPVYNPPGTDIRTFRNRAAALNALGFETKIYDTKGDHIFTQSETRVLGFRAVNWQERKFSTRAAADSFASSLQNMIVKRAGSNAVPWRPIETSIVER